MVLTLILFIAFIYYSILNETETLPAKKRVPLGQEWALTIYSCIFYFLLFKINRINIYMDPRNVTVG